jgi:hypothetical protein
MTDRRATQLTVFIAIVIVLASIGFFGGFMKRVRFDILGHPSAVVPASPTGYWDVVCQESGGAGYAFIAESGASVSCRNRAKPHFSDYATDPTAR